MAKKKDIVKLYSIFKDGLWERTVFHSEKSSIVWSTFWTLLICGGWDFEDDDFVKLQKELLRQKWVFRPPNEYNYTQAVRIDNIAFCRAYETYFKRKPFIWQNIDYGYYFKQCLLYGMHSTQAKSRGRLILEAKFIWQGFEVKVTSFKDEQQSLIACAYHKEVEGKSATIKKQFTITPQNLKDERKNQKEKQKKSLPK